MICYSASRRRTRSPSEFRALADVWHDTARLSDDELAALIRADQIDILVDLSGHTRANRLLVFAREPAPVQVTAWGYATGTGLDTMHYFLADPIVVPPEARAAYAEEVVDLPNISATSRRVRPAGLPPPALERGHVTFGAFNRLPKISAEAVRRLGTCPGRRAGRAAGVKSGGLEHAAERARLLDRFAAQWIARSGDAARRDAPPRAPGRPRRDRPDARLVPAHRRSHHPRRAADGRAGRDAARGGRRRAALGVVPDGARARRSGRPHHRRVRHDRRAPGRDPDRLAPERATLRERLLASPIGDAQAYTRAVEAVYRDTLAPLVRKASRSGPGG